MKINQPTIITFEGNCGSGKTTLAKSLQQHLGTDTVYHRQPSDNTPLGMNARQLIEDNADPSEILTAVVTDAADTHWGVVIPALESGKSVILDRGLFSALVYQGDWLGEDAVLDAWQRAHPPTVADVYHILVDTPADVCIQRIAQRSKPDNRLDTVPLIDFEYYRNRFRCIAESTFATLIVDGTLPVETTVKGIIQHVNQCYLPY